MRLSLGSFVSKERELSVGETVRNYLDRFFSALYPYLRIVIPNFKVAHYVYILTASILGSILLFPVRNGRYIDFLFFGVGSSTQAGLNTIDVNKLTLYQQIVMYVMSFLTTPIFIHGFVLLIRLYWFERYFDNIKETSKLNFKMRRSATLGARAATVSSTRINTVTNQTLGGDQGDFRPAQEIRSSSPRVRSPSPQESSPHTSESTYTDNSEEKNASIHMEQPKIPSAVSAIKFGDLPHPERKRSDIDPTEMSRSIAMMRNNIKPSVEENDDDDDEVLVIKSPNEIEKEESGPIFTKRLNQIHFTNLEKPSSKRKHRGRLLKSRHHRRTMSDVALSREVDDENNSIDSEVIHDIDASDGDLTDHRLHGQLVDSGSESDDIQEGEIHKASSHMPSHKPNAAGRNVARRANTLDYGPSSASPHRSDAHRNPMRRIRSRITRTFTGISSDEESIDSNRLSRRMSTNYLSWNPTVGRNSTFVQLSEQQKEELGGVEYRAVKTLIKIVFLYYAVFHIIGALAHLGWILSKPKYISVVREAGVSPSWWAFFASGSAFNDVGYTLTENSMISFNKSLYIMIWEAILIVIGNTGFPILLRFIIWILFKTAKPLSLYRESLGFLLDHPRRCFTLLFPSGPTWWLLLVLVILNVVDLIFFIILDLNNEYIKDIPPGYRVMCGIYQAVSTRTAGLAVVDLSQLHVAVQVSYLIMMYISVLPIAISIRRTNVYEEQSLGVYLRDDKDEENEKNPQNFIGNHLRNQLSFDLWFIFLAVFIICIAEGSKLDKDDLRFTPFAVLFEVVSAYGTVGLSLGYPTVNYSFSGEFSTISKLVVIATMIRGRHRGLPYTLDRAIILPSEMMKRKDQLQETHALRRQATLERSNTQSTGTDLFRMLTRRGSNVIRRRSTANTS